MSKELLKEKVKDVVYDTVDFLDLLPSDAFVKFIDDRNAIILIGWLYEGENYEIVKEFAISPIYVSLDEDKDRSSLGSVLASSCPNCIVITDSGVERSKEKVVEIEVKTPISIDKLKALGFIPFGELF